MDHLLDLLLGPLGLTIGLIFALVSGWKGWWVWGKDYRKLEREKNEWKDAALRGTRLAEHVVSRVEREHENL
jgi:hypothetical protein